MYKIPSKLPLPLSIILPMISLTACQTMPTKPVSTTQTVSYPKLTPKRLDGFAITGKIGIVNSLTKESGSAFYAWGQQDNRFTIELQGAFGLGFTTVSYDGKTTKLVNDSVGTITSKTPEILLMRATGWQAPISQFPYWISGSPAPTDSRQTLDGQRRLIQAINGRWTANFDYSSKKTLPKKIIAHHTNGSRVTMTINHQERK